MKVLNIHTLGGKLPPNSLYIGNKNTQYHLEKSKYANPFYLENWSREKKIKMFEEWLLLEIEDGRITKLELASLFGKDLVCFCNPKPCHGNILRKYIIQSYYELNRGS